MLGFFLASSPIFAVVLLGFAAARLGRVTPEAFQAFASYAFHIALPALVAGLLSRQPLATSFSPRFFAALLGAGAAVFAATAAVTALAGGGGPGVAGAHAQAATTGNLGFLGVPLLLAVLGERATGPIAMAVLAEVGLLMPAGIALMSVGLSRRRPGDPSTSGGSAAAPRAGSLAGDLARATLGNPVVLGVVFGAIVGVSGAPLPGPVDRFLGFVGGSAGSTALFALGGSLAGRHLAKDWPAVAGIAVAKLVVYPGLAWLCLRLAGLDPAWVAAGVLIAALPTAANVFVYAQRFDAVPPRISAEILVSTVAAALTFPLAAWLVL